MINPFGIISTIFAFKFVQKYNKIPYLRSISPILLSGIILILILKAFNIKYETYLESANYLTYLLIPATISLGYPLYKNINKLFKNKRVIYFSFFFAVILTLIFVVLIGKIIDSEMMIIASMLPKSITAPLALETAKQMQATPELTVCTVVLTGVVGGMFGHKILDLVKVKNNTAIGIALGAASHVIGTSKCIEKGNQTQITMSTLALIVVGILTVVFMPLIWKILA